MIRAKPCHADEVRHLLEAIKSPKADAAGRVDLERLIAQGQAFRVIDAAGATVAAYLLRPVGAELWVTAYAGSASFDLAAVGAALFVQHAAEFDAVVFRTERRGLVRKAMRHGCTVVRQQGNAYYMKRTLK